MNHKNFLIVLCFLAVLNSVIWSWKFWSEIPQGDGLHYNSLAISLLKEKSYAENDQVTFSRDPAYAFFIAGVYSVFGLNHYSAVRAIQLGLFVGVVLLTYSLAFRLSGRERTARMAGLLTALFYPLAFHVGIFFTEVLFTFLLLGAVYFFVKGQQEEKYRFYAWSGLFFGLAALTRSVVLFFPPFFLIVFVFFQKSSRKKALAAASIFLLIFAAVVVPWIYRNFRLFGRFATASQDATVLFFASQRLQIPNSDLPKVFAANVLGDFFAQKIFGSYNRFVIEEQEFGQVMRTISEQGIPEQQANRELRIRAWQEINTHPLRYLLIVPPIAFLKLHTPIFPYASVQGLFSDSTRYQNVPDLVKAIVILSIRVGYWLFLVLVVYGIIRARKRKQDHKFIFALLFYMVAVYSAVHGIPRYSLPIFPLYIIFFSSAAVFLLTSKNSALQGEPLN